MAKSTTSTLSVRVDNELRRKLKNYVGLRLIAGESTTESEVARNALEIYLESIDEVLEAARQNLPTSQLERLRN